MRTHRRESNIVYLSFLYVPIAAVVLWTVGFLLTRVQLFHEALKTEELSREREAWLMQECRKPEFYAHMKHHSALCDQVEVHAKGSLYLAAAMHLVQATYLCGYEPCSTVIDRALDWMGGHTVLFSCVALVILFLPTLVLPFYREYLNRTAKNYTAAHQYHMLEDARFCNRQQPHSLSTIH
jgi:hypothetical protein